MTIHFNCDSCGTPINAPDIAEGKTGKCTQCNAQLIVPMRRRAALPDMPDSGADLASATIAHGPFGTSQAASSDSAATNEVVFAAMSSDISNAVLKRYEDAYLVARVVVTLGDYVKGAGVFLGLIILASSPLVGELGLALGLATALTGITTGGLIYVWGVFISASGQMLWAQLDAAVHGSPFLTDIQRAAAMSLFEIRN